MVSHCHYTRDKTVNSPEKKTHQYTHQSQDTHRSIHVFTHPDTASASTLRHIDLSIFPLSHTIIDAVRVLIQSPQDTGTSHGSYPGLTETLSGEIEVWEARKKRNESHINDRLKLYQLRTWWDCWKKKVENHGVCEEGESFCQMKSLDIEKEKLK